MTYRISIFVFLVACVFVMASNVPAVAEPVKAKSIYDATGPWQLFIDDYLIASEKNVVRRYHSFRKHRDGKVPIPVLEVDKPWEAHVVNVMTVLPGEDGEGFRMWYYCWSEDKNPDGSRRGGQRICYATSEDGIHWVKPNLGLYDWDGGGHSEPTKDNNMLPPKSPVFVIPTPWEKDPNKKYHGVGGMYDAYTSPDGLRWTLLAEKIISGGDTSHFYWDYHTNRFRCHVKGGGGPNVDSALYSMPRRTVGFSESDDMKKFPPLRLVMVPDDVDDCLTKPCMSALSSFIVPLSRSGISTVRFGSN